MSGLSIEDLTRLKTLAVVAMNNARSELEQSAGADFLAALAVDGDRAQPRLGETSRSRRLRVRALADLSDRVGVVLDEQLVADDPDGQKFPAAHARYRERMKARP